MSIEVKNLTKTYGEQNAVDNTSFSVKKGEVVGFLGPNGAGKSTTMKIITGYLPATEGEVIVCDIKVDAENVSTQKRLVISQKPIQCILTCTYANT